MTLRFDGIGAGNQVQPHRHICWFYESAEQRADLACDFLRGAILTGLRAVYVCHGESPRDVVEQFRLRGLDTDTAQARGALVILSAGETYVQDGVFSAERMLALLDATVERALNDGFLGMAACADMSWVLDVMPAVDEVLGYEALCNQFVSSCRATGVCLFDRQRFPPALVERFATVHPWSGSDRGFAFDV